MKIQLIDGSLDYMVYFGDEFTNELITSEDYLI